MPNAKKTVLRQVEPENQKLDTAVRDTVRYGRSMFYPFTRQEISLRFNRETAIDDGDTDFLEASTCEAGALPVADIHGVT